MEWVLKPEGWCYEPKERFVNCKCVNIIENLCVPSPDEQSHSHREQHDQSSHRDDHNDHHRVLFTGRQSHWNKQQQRRVNRCRNNVENKNLIQVVWQSFHFCFIWSRRFRLFSLVWTKSLGVKAPVDSFGLSLDQTEPGLVCVKVTWTIVWTLGPNAVQFTHHPLPSN